MEEITDNIESNPISTLPKSASSRLRSLSSSLPPLQIAPEPTQSTTKPKTGHEVTFSSNTPDGPRSGARSPMSGGRTPQSGARTPMAFIKSTLTRGVFLTPLGSPLRKALNLTKLDPKDAWLPITESRNGNAYYAAFHTLCAGIGIQALILPVAFTILGWAWGIITLTLTFIWQLYTLYLLVNLHESSETRVRYSRYMQLANAAFGERWAKIIAKFPIIYLSAGTCIACIIIGASTSKIFFQIVCAATECKAQTLTVVEWYLVFTCGAILLSQLPNLNSIAGISLIGAITALGYCSTIWIVSVSKGRLPGVSYNPVRVGTRITNISDVLNALGMIAFAFRGHNLVLEIQATMPSSEKNPARVPMWKGLKVSYSLIAACLFPLAIGGYWAYGHMLPPGGMLTAVFIYHSQDVSKSVLAFTSLLVIINSLSSFQIYGMATFDELESIYVTRWKKPCPWWLRVIIRTLFGFTCFFVAVAFPFVGGTAGLVGGFALPVTLVYPCFMWLFVKKPKIYSPQWWLNWGLGVIGTILSVLLIAGGVYVLIHDGIKIAFFKPM